jgi:hypothetical protein
MLLEWLEVELFGTRNVYRKTCSELELENLNEREHLGDTEIDENILLKWTLYVVSECGLDSSYS